MRLFRVDEHPIEDRLIIREFEIVHSTPKYFFISPRNVKNKAAEKSKTKIRRIQVDYPILTMNNYFRSKEEAEKAYTAIQLNLIAHGKTIIERATIDLKRIEYLQTGPNP